MEDPAITFGPIDKMTVGLARIIHQTVLPQRYEEDFYKQLVEGKVVHGELAFMNGDVAVGEVCYTINENGEEKELVIKTFSVLKVYQRRGIATKLIQNLLEKNSTIHTFRTHVQPGNSAAIAFLQKLGFHEVGRDDGFFKTLDDHCALVYSMTR